MGGGGGGGDLISGGGVENFLKSNKPGGRLC